MGQCRVCLQEIVIVKCDGTDAYSNANPNSSANPDSNSGADSNSSANPDSNSGADSNANPNAHSNPNAYGWILCFHDRQRCQQWNIVSTVGNHSARSQRG
jgi:hypothetical protein